MQALTSGIQRHVLGTCRRERWKKGDINHMLLFLFPSRGVGMQAKVNGYVCKSKIGFLQQ